MSLADRVRKLAALAGSDNEHEASEAARQACKLIREGKVAVRDVVEQAPADQRAQSPWDELFRRAWRPFEYPPPPPPPPPSARRPRPNGPFTRRPDVAGAECRACGEPIPAGDAFGCAEGYVHGDCVPTGERG